MRLKHANVAYPSTLVCGDGGLWRHLGTSACWSPHSHHLSDRQTPSCSGDPLSPSRFPPVLREILLVAVRADLLVLGVVSPLVHGGDGESHWGLGGLGIGVVKIFNVRTVDKAVLEPSKKEEESGSTSFIEVENLHRLH